MPLFYRVVLPVLALLVAVLFASTSSSSPTAFLMGNTSVGGGRDSSTWTPMWVGLVAVVAFVFGFITDRLRGGCSQATAKGVEEAAARSTLKARMEFYPSAFPNGWFALVSPLAQQHETHTR